MKIAILLLSCTGTARRTELTVDWFRMLARQVRQYFYDQSGGRLTCEFSVFDWLQLSFSTEDWQQAGIMVGDRARAEAADYHGFAEADFDRFILVIDDQIAVGGVTDYKTDTRVSADDATPALIEHELGHAFGVRHTQLETPEGPSEYDGPFCVMGREGGKHSFFDPVLVAPDVGAAERHSASGPGMCLVSLSQATWLDIDQHCHRLTPVSSGSIAATVRIAALDGAPSGPVATRVGCVIDTYDRFVIEYRHPDSRWDAGLPVGSASGGWLVAYRSPSQGPLNALQAGATPVAVGASLVIDDHPFYLFGGGPLRLWVVSIDQAGRTIDLRVQKSVGKPPRYFATESLFDFLHWPILSQEFVKPDEPVDQLAESIGKLRELRFLERVSGPRAAPSLRLAAQAQVRQIRDLIANLDGP